MSVADTPQKASAEALASTTAVTVTTSLPSITDPSTGLTMTVLVSLGAQQVEGVNSRVAAERTTSVEDAVRCTRTSDVGALGIRMCTRLPVLAS